MELKNLIKKTGFRIDLLKWLREGRKYESP